MFEPTSGSPGLPLTYSTYWFDALRALAAANVSVYVVDPLGLPSAGPGVSSAGPTSPGFAAAMANGALSPGDSAISFAQETGGVAFVRTNRFDRAVEQIWREAGEYYLLGYEPPVIDGKPHRIDVRVKRRGAQVRARRTRF